jgi:2,4-diketo-3-deoxy-L-fuconate hydrolase
MRFATIRTGAGTTAARLDGDTLIPLNAADVGALLTADGGLAAAAARPGAAPVPAAGADFAPVVTNPSKVICVGLNYRTHIMETGRELPEYPTLFAKFAETLTGANDDLAIPAVSEKVDWEVELGVIIGKRASYVEEGEALDYVAGYCVCNDVSEREFQIERGGTWDKGKGCDSFGPLGPWLVTRDEVADPQDLAMWLEVNGKRFQDGSTRTMIFGVAHLVSYISRFMTLLPGDVISTGTPPGVGLGQKPPLFLKPGDVVRLGIDGLGEQKQRCRAWARG